MVLKELIFTIFYFGMACCGLERTQFLRFSTLGGCCGLERTELRVSTLVGYGGLESTDF